jgi:hypothetical protein
MLSGRLGYVAVDHREAIEADHRRQAAADGGPGQMALLLHPPGVELDVGAPDDEDLELRFGTPAEPGPQVGGVASPGGAGVASQETADRQTGLVEQRWARR